MRNEENEDESNLVDRLKRKFYDHIIRILNSTIPSPNIDLILCVIQLCQCLAFPFSPKFLSLYTKDSKNKSIILLYRIFSRFFAYCTVSPFLLLQGFSM